MFRCLPGALGKTALLALCFTTTASAAELVCSGTVVEMSYHAQPTGVGSQLYVRLSSMNTIVAVCSPDVEWSAPGTVYVTPPAACKAIYATLLAARLSGLTVNSMYFDGNEVPSSCSGWGNWLRANVRHYRL